MYEQIVARFHALAPQVDFCSLRLVQTRSEFLSVRQNILQPVSTSEDVGAMVTVIDGGGLGYAATSDLSDTGLRGALEYASAWARRSAGRSVVDFSHVALPRPHGEYLSPVQIRWEAIPLQEKIELLRTECERLKVDERIVDWETSLWHTDTDTLYVTADGGQCRC
jgi:predicted Zn-dependent protease